jgi:integrase
LTPHSISTDHYQPRPVYRDPPIQLIKESVIEVFSAFIKWKAKEIDKRSLEKYNVTLQTLKVSIFGKFPAIDLTEDEAQYFSDHLKEEHKLSPRTLKERITLLRACWDWKKLPNNPWIEVRRRIKVPPTQPPTPFTPHEINFILEVFERDYSNYYPYVLFLFSTGVRTSEAIGLRWRHISPNFTSIWIGESLTKGVKKSTKNNKARTIVVTPKVRDVLEAIRPPKAKPDGLVFTSIGGGVIDVDNFTKRYWVSALEKAGVEYRRPYNTRHSFISNCLEIGMNPVTIASITGHKVETLFEYYAGLISPPVIPVLF